MKDIALIKELLDKLEVFKLQQGKEEFTLEKFGLFLSGSISNSVVDFNKSRNKENPEHQLNVLSGIYITYLYRYARYYAKNLQKEHGGLNYDEFSYIATLFEHKELTPSKLIELNIQEKTSGIEIIRRLLSAGYLIEKPNENDKRSKILTLSEAGVQAFFQSTIPMTKLSTILTADLNIDEKRTLVSLLERLHLWHNPLFLEKDKLKEILDIPSNEP